MWSFGKFERKSMFMSLKSFRAKHQYSTAWIILTDSRVDAILVLFGLESAGGIVTKQNQSLHLFCWLFVPILNMYTHNPFFRLQKDDLNLSSACMEKNKIWNLPGKVI